MLHSMIFRALYSIPVLILLIGSLLYFFKSKSPLGIVMAICSLIHLGVLAVSFVFMYMMNHNSGSEFYNTFRFYMSASSILRLLSDSVFAISFLIIMINFQKSKFIASRCS
jgi:hypothetical protein